MPMLTELHTYYVHPTGVAPLPARGKLRPRDVTRRLEREKVEHVCRQQAGSGMWQIFLHDPNGAKVELDFAPDERPSAP